MNSLAPEPRGDRMLKVGLLVTVPGAKYMTRSRFMMGAVCGW
jgi:hypothetical protein